VLDCRRENGYSGRVPTARDLRPATAWPYVPYSHAQHFSIYARNVKGKMPENAGKCRAAATAGWERQGRLAEATSPARNTRGRLGEPSLPSVTDALQRMCLQNAAEL
jgi:hypothetical protein